MQFNSQSLQNRLDAAAVQIRKDAADLRALADHLCNDGQHDASAIARQMAGQLETVYGLGRALSFTLDGGEVKPLSGGK